MLPRKVTFTIEFIKENPFNVSDLIFRGSPSKVSDIKVLAPLVSGAGSPCKSSPIKALIINLKTQQVTPRSPVSTGSSMATLEGRKTSPRKKLFPTDENCSPLKKPGFSLDVETLNKPRPVVELCLTQPGIKS